MSKRLLLTPCEPCYPSIDTLLSADGVLLVGRSRASHLCLSPLVVSARHAELRLGAAGELLVTDLSRNGIRMLSSPREGETPRGEPAAAARGEVIKGCSDGGRPDTRAVPDGARLVLVTAKELTPSTISYRVRLEDAGPRPATGKRKGAPCEAAEAAGERETGAQGMPLPPGAAQGAPGSSHSAHARAPVDAAPPAPSASPGHPRAVEPADAPARLRENPRLTFITDRPLHSDFEVGAFVQEGGFAKVYRCTERASGKLFAVKRVEKALYKNTTGSPHSAHDPSNMRTEVEILNQLRHINVVRLYQVYDEKDYLWIVQVGGVRWDGGAAPSSEVVAGLAWAG